MNPRNGWSQPSAGWGQPHLPGWAPLVDGGPAPLQAARTVGRWLWPTVAVTGFLVVTGFVVGHDDPAPGLSRRSLLTVTLAAVVVVLLTIRRAAGPGPLARALFEYAVVFLLAVLVATIGVPIDQAPAAGKPTAGKQASAIPDQRPALVKTLDSFRDWLNEWRAWARKAWARKENDRRTQPPSTTSPKPTGNAMPHSPALQSSSTRRPL